VKSDLSRLIRLRTVPPGVTFFMTKESNQRKSCEIESHEGRPGKAGSGLRDFDGTDYALKEASKSQIWFVRPYQGFVSISRTMFDRPPAAAKEQPVSKDLFCLRITERL